MTKFQLYSHFKLPITRDPLNFGKLIDQTNNKFILQLSTKNVAVINHFENENLIKIFRNGDLVLEFRDKFINENSFIRFLNDTKFLFENDKLISTQISNAFNLFSNNITPFFTCSGSLLNSKITYSDTNALILNNKSPLFYKFLESTYIYELFILIYIIFFVIYSDTDTLVSMVPFIPKNIIKLRRVSPKYIWNEIVFKVNNKVFTKTLFESIFSKFWNNIKIEFRDNNHMFILLKIKYNNGDFSTIGKVQRLTISEFSWYIDFIIENMKFKSEYYNETQIDSFIISYGFKKGPIENKDNLSLNIQKYTNYDLPISINPIDYGRLVSQDKLENGTLFILQNNQGQTIKFTKFDRYNEIEFFKSGISLLKFKDIFINNNTFIRIINKKSFYFKNGEQVLYLSEMKTKFIDKTNKSKNLVNNFITLDIETYIHDNTLVPYLISFYDGKNPYAFWLGDYNSVEDMILDCLKSILIRKYHKYQIYVHNLAKFDIIFLLKYLVKVGSLNPVIHNGRIISIRVNFGKNYYIDFKDSYLILLNPLLKLCDAFKVKTVKSIFPHFFVNQDNLNYEGLVPKLNYFGDKTSLEEYNYYKKRFNNKNLWNLKNEAIKYCEIDCISLYQVIFKFNDMIFNLFSKNIHQYPTLPSLAFAIFRSSFMEENSIPQLSGQIANDIRQGYTGGSVDVYIPQSKKGVKINAYDVNSLYPFTMNLLDMPVGSPTYFEGDISVFKAKAFGFFYCNIIAPDNIKHPILQTHVKTKNGVRTISPIGMWEDMLFSQEIYNARKFGYQIEILWGYTFEKSNVFKGYVDFLYNLRQEYSRSHPLNYIAKILLNSLYGRFGMDDNFSEINIIHKDYYSDFENKFFDNIENKIELSDYWLVIYKIPINNSKEELETHNVSIAIASAITAYARIHMSQFKNNSKINLYYTDTDSIYTDSELDEDLLSETVLGKLKLENVCKKAVFLTPKVYCLETIDGKIIYKAKGLKHEIELTMKDFEHLLYKDTLIEKTQTKWFRKLSDGKINLLDELYTLKVNDNKRELIYNKNNKLIATKAYKIDKSKDLT